MSERGCSETGVGHQEEEKLGHLERLLLALKEREAYSKESAPADSDNPDGIDSVDYIELKPEEAEFVRKFLDFKIDVPQGETPKYIIAPSASPIIDRDRYRQRIEGAVALGQQYPGAKVIFSGKMPAEERRTGREKEPEAELMADEAIRLGLPAENIIAESESGHTKENIQFFLRDHKEEILATSEPVRVVIASSQTMLRRCYYCTELLLKTEYPELIGKVEFSYLPTGDDLNDPENNQVKYYDDEGNVTEEGGYFSYYEARRLLEYRKKGWL